MTDDAKGPQPIEAGTLEDPRFALINERIDRQTKFFASAARSAKWRYRWFNVASIVVAAFVPIIALLPPLLSLDGNAVHWVAPAAGTAGANRHAS